MTQALESLELVACAEESITVIETRHAGGFELAHDRRAIESDGHSDPRNDPVDGAEGAPPVMNLAGRGADAHVAAQRIEDADPVPAGARRLDEASGGIEGWVAGEEDEAHGKSGDGGGC